MTRKVAVDKLDPECVSLCAAINSLAGLHTVESCCGHGKVPYRIWLRADSLEALPPLLYWLAYCHSGLSGWHAKVITDCAMSLPTFEIEGPIGAYTEADEIARLIIEEERDSSIKWTGKNWPEVFAFIYCRDVDMESYALGVDNKLEIQTSRGVLYIHPEQYIVRNEHGELSAEREDAST